MTLPTDMRIASTDARFGFVFAHRGLVPEAASSWFLPRIVGITQALDWVYTGRVFDAEEAKAGGLVSRVVAPEELQSTAREMALVIVLVGERPGLSSPDSLGVYMTHAPAPGLTDEARNCISNVRAAGLPVEEAVRKLCYLVENALVRRLSGVDLKDDVPPGYLPFAETRALG